LSASATLAGDQQAAAAITTGSPATQFCRATHQLLGRSDYQGVPLPSVAAASKPTGRYARRSSDDWATITCCDQPAMVATPVAGPPIGFKRR
jgi:hypothetical protein